mgnify:CR=1 FL=1
MTIKSWKHTITALLSVFAFGGVDAQVVNHAVDTLQNGYIVIDLQDTPQDYKTSNKAVITDEKEIKDEPDNKTYIQTENQTNESIENGKWTLEVDGGLDDDGKNLGVLLQKTDTVAQMTIDPQLQSRWIPNSKKALWYAIVFPGGGQIYNRKFWKLPLIYGGFLGCVYAINWNNTMYHDYAQAYVDIMDDDPNTASFYNFLPINYNIDANLERLQSLFKKRKDFYRRYRDLSIFCLIGVYALSIVDA